METLITIPKKGSIVNIYFILKKLFEKLLTSKMGYDKIHLL